MFERQQKPDGCFPQNSRSTASRTGRTSSSTRSRSRSCSRGSWAHRRGRPTRRHQAGRRLHPRQRAADAAGALGEPGGLVAGDDRLGDRRARHRRRDRACQRRHRAATAWEAKADEWQAKVDDWTYTTTGPYGDGYYLRLTKDGEPERGHRPTPSATAGPRAVDQRRVVDTSFLELVRLGVKRADDPQIVSTLAVVDAQLAADTPNGRFWHRFNFDGYGEQKDGSEWNFGFPPNRAPRVWENNLTIGRIWPIFAGERGEYELAAGSRPRPARARRDGARRRRRPHDARAGLGPVPALGQPGFPKGEATLSASPLAWSHAQFVRLAWSIDAGRPVERPAVVACRYAGCG